ncbi:MAG: acetyltransferase [Ruminococcaceae bacterium]|nr:acetyltransferase [Oscillospiraceae bacterium]
MNRLIIIGAGGHGRVVADIAEKIGIYESICFLDDADLDKSGHYNVIGRVCDYTDYMQDFCFIVAIGHASIRKQIQAELEEKGARLATLIHPAAVLGSRVQIGQGSVVVAGAVIGPDVVIGKGVIVNTCSSVDHDCCIGDFSHISVGAHVAGTVSIGAESMIGAGAVISNNISICSKCVIGAGAVVVRNIDEQGTYIGVPAQKNN